MFQKSALIEEYSRKKLSVAVIAKKYHCSQSKVNYWLAQHGIPKRSISDAIYSKWNPKGDPFSFSEPKNIEEAFLYGLGLGLYWGEGTKKSHSVRLGNSDPRIISAFIHFLKETYAIDQSRLRFGLQIFGDMDKDALLRFWSKRLNVSRRQFYKPIVTPYRGVGNYRQKSQSGVLTVYFNNRRLRDILVSSIEKYSM